MTDEQLQLFCDELFQEVDEDGSGKIDRDEYKRFFVMLGKSDEEVEKEINDVYTSEDQELTKEELYELLRKKIKRPGEESPEKIITEHEQQSPMIEVRVEHIYDINQVQAIPD